MENGQECATWPTMHRPDYQNKAISSPKCQYGEVEKLGFNGFLLALW